MSILAGRIRGAGGQVVFCFVKAGKIFDDGGIG
jgi:hypothetical protein